MPIILDTFRFVLIAVAGWMNQRQLQAIDYEAQLLMAAGDVARIRAAPMWRRVSALR